MKNRSIAMCIILSIITCGIYGIYWMICLNNEMCAATPDDSFQTSGGTVFLLTLVTCGVYGLYWIYKMGCKMDQLNGGSSHTILFLVLQIFGLGIVNYCIMQGQINKMAQ